LRLRGLWESDRLVELQVKGLGGLGERLNGLGGLKLGGLGGLYVLRRLG
jgi:hypothetical protein